MGRRRFAKDEHRPEEWAVMDRDYSSSLIEATEALKASTFQPWTKIRVRAASWPKLDEQSWTYPSVGWTTLPEWPPTTMEDLATATAIVTDYTSGFVPLVLFTATVCSRPLFVYSVCVLFVYTAPATESNILLLSNC